MTMKNLAIFLFALVILFVWEFGHHLVIYEKKPENVHVKKVAYKANKLEEKPAEKTIRPAVTTIPSLRSSPISLPPSNSSSPTVSAAPVTVASTNPALTTPSTSAPPASTSPASTTPAASTQAATISPPKTAFQENPAPLQSPFDFSGGPQGYNS